MTTIRPQDASTLHTFNLAGSGKDFTVDAKVRDACRHGATTA
jgi:hypothetical protein